jgi:hypothetical protein
LEPLVIFLFTWGGRRLRELTVSSTGLEIRADSVQPCMYVFHPYIHIYMCIYKYICTCKCICICKCNMYIYIYVCMFVCMYVCIYINKHETVLYCVQ